MRVLVEAVIKVGVVIMLHVIGGDPFDRIGRDHQAHVESEVFVSDHGVLSK